MYKFNDKNEEEISLHDCRTTSAELNGDKLIFRFTDGFWIGANHEKNPYKKIVSTDASEIEICLLEDYEDVNVFIFTEKRGKTIRESWKVTDFIEKINDGTYELEFLYPYKGYRSMIFECMVWSKKRPYSKECVLILPTEEITYKWNQVLEDRGWD